MAELTLPIALDKDYWTKTAGKDFEKTANLSKLLDKVGTDHDTLKKELDKLAIEVDPDDPNPTKAAEALAKEVEAGPLKKIAPPCAEKGELGKGQKVCVDYQNSKRRDGDLYLPVLFKVDARFHG